MPAKSEGTLSDEIQSCLSRFQDVKVASRHLLPADIQTSLQFFDKAFEALDRLFQRQQDEALPELFDNVKKSPESNLFIFIKAFRGPWHPLTGKSLCSSLAPKKPTREFYPGDLTLEEWETHLEKSTPEAQAALLDPRTVVRRQNRTFIAIPFHQYYAEELKAIAENLVAAAHVISNPDLKNSLIRMADALLTGNHRALDELWVRMKNLPVELNIAADDPYEDGFLGKKRAYFGVLYFVDHELSTRFQDISLRIAEFAREIPVPNGATSSVGKIAPVVVGTVVRMGGSLRYGFPAGAFVGPNDAWVRENVGQKQVLLISNMEGKFHSVVAKVGKIIFGKSVEFKFDPFFYFVLLHEMCHCMGPATRENGDRVQGALGKNSAAFEEAKANAGSILLLLRHRGEFGIPDFAREDIIRSHIATCFRTMRFGLGNAHALSAAMDLSWHLKSGSLQESAHGLVVIPERLESVVEGFLTAICTLQASGSPTDAEAFLTEYGQLSPANQARLDALADLPIDIRLSCE